MVINEKVRLPDQIRVVKGVFLAILLAVMTAGCDTFTPVPDGRIEFRNDLKGSEYTDIQLSSGALNTTVSSRQSVLLPPGTQFFQLTYNNGRETRSYSVSCPSNISGGIRIKLIDITQNRLAGGCSANRNS